MQERILERVLAHGPRLRFFEALRVFDETPALPQTVFVAGTCLGLHCVHLGPGESLTDPCLLLTLSQPLPPSKP